jgi:protein-S-isoprenylcysteine O-methyltransferase Ste14
MPQYFAVLTIVLLVAMVISRAILLKRKGITAMQFGKLDKTDFLSPPFALFYFYLVFAHAFGWPTPVRQELLPSELATWSGVLICLAGLALFAWALVSFGQSFRVGIDVEHPDKLVTAGAFAVSRNPIYAALALVLAGQFLIFSHWLLLVYLAAAAWLFHRQVLREEVYLKEHYGQEYLAYCQRVRRYV